jgi:hypothetical protein
MQQQADSVRYLNELNMVCLHLFFGFFFLPQVSDWIDFVVARSICEQRHISNPRSI